MSNEDIKTQVEEILVEAINSTAIYVNKGTSLPEEIEDKATTQILSLIEQSNKEAVHERLGELIHKHAMKKTAPLTYENDDAQLGKAVRKEYLRLAKEETPDV